MNSKYRAAIVICGCALAVGVAWLWLGGGHEDATKVEQDKSQPAAVDSPQARANRLPRSRNTSSPVKQVTQRQPSAAKAPVQQPSGAAKTATQSPAKPSIVEPNAVAEARKAILAGPYGTVPIESVVQALRDISGGPEVQEVIKALVARKDEALPLVKERLRTGEWYEKHLLTKLLQCSPWPEAYEELLGLAQSTEEHYLARQGALYALGALGDPAAGPTVAGILRNPETPADIQLVAIATLTRIGYRDAVEDILPFATSADIQIRIFANRALAELGGPADREFLLSALDHTDYVMRDEACAALSAVEGEEITSRLQIMAETDKNEAVRVSARQSLIRREIRGQTPQDKLKVLKSALESADRRTDTWIVQTILDECGPQGRTFVQTLAARDDRIGERARTYLLWQSGR